jgi:hypothetical protein
MSSPSVGVFRAVTRGCCPKNPDQWRALKTVIAGGRGTRVACFFRPTGFELACCYESTVNCDCGCVKSQQPCAAPALHPGGLNCHFLATLDGDLQRVGGLAAGDSESDAGTDRVSAIRQAFHRSCRESYVVGEEEFKSCQPDLKLRPLVALKFGELFPFCGQRLAQISAPSPSVPKGCGALSPQLGSQL